MSLPHLEVLTPRRAPRPGRLAALALALALAWTPEGRATEPDFSGWSDILQHYVKVVAQKGKPWGALFDYQQLYIDQKIWETDRADGLHTLHGELLSVSPSDLSPAERMAWAINTYNFLVVERMTLHLLVHRRKMERYETPLDIHTEDGGFFSAPVAVVEGRTYSLAGFERRFVYGDTSADPMADGMMARERPGDPRLMFALCKAAMCTGPLVPWAYRADSLDKQLDRAARLALALPQYVHADVKTGELAASNRFFDERCDFGGPELPGLVPFLHKHGTSDTKRLIASKKLTHVTRFFQPDWSLNFWNRPRPTLPGQEDSTATSRAQK